MTRADDILARMRRDDTSDWGLRLMRDIADAPTVSEVDLWHTSHGPILTDRELDVLRCASVGLTRDQTADTLGIALNTVLSHLSAARYRLRAKNTPHAVALAIRQGLIA